ncbi:heterokaryon incompatibility protein-domain-containing protein [Xylariales sp. PMI_506]|nr:heterokaryon incompatibility protein-domain-containing protein [Xylariales sp. PMI_506]
MTTCCAGWKALLLPEVADFGENQKLSRSICLECSYKISMEDAAKMVAGGEDATLSSASWCASPRSEFCQYCHCCNFALEGLVLRYNAAMQVALQETIGMVETACSHLEVVLLLDTLTYHISTGKRDVDGNISEYKGISLVDLQGTVQISVDTAISAEQSIDITLPFEIFTKHDDIENSLTVGIYRHDLDVSVASPKNIQKIRGWLDHCVAGHPECDLIRQEQDGANCLNIDDKWMFIPKRLVYVGDPLAGEDPRVVISNQEFKTGSIEAGQARYVALSYCWGSEAERKGSLISDTSNIDDWMRAIPWVRMPRTFQDVVLLAIQLGVHYVWIDSLCILQGAGGDWAVESAKMWSVYSNAFITAIAASGSSPHAGFLTRSAPHSCKISVGGTQDSFWLRHRPGTKWWGSDRMAEITGKRWITRGWTYQEERLARRVLMFGENKFFFDCRMRERCEDTEVWHHRPSWSRIIYDSDAVPDDNTPAATMQLLRRTFDHWQWLCVQYSHRQLTVLEDKLPAFSGVAAAVASKVHSRYLAGLWEANLLHDVFWDTSGAAQKSPTYRAPSWSWASLDTNSITWRRPSTCLGERCRAYCRILQVESILAGSNLFGTIKDAFIKLEGHVVYVELVPKDAWDRGADPWTAIHQGEQLADAKLDLLRSSTERSNAVSLNMFAFLISTCGTGYKATRGLLLRNTGTRDGLPLYERVGTFVICAKNRVELAEKLSTWTHKAPVVIMLE